MDRFVVPGCSSGGASTLVGALAARGCAVVPEPGRRFVREGGPMPWDGPEGFARRAVAMSQMDREAAARRGAGSSSTAARSTPPWRSTP